MNAADATDRTQITKSLRWEWYAVYYQTGGTANFRWLRAADQQGWENARDAVNALRNAGYPAHYGLRTLVESVGLPDTFQAADAAALAPVE